MDFDGHVERERSFHNERFSEESREAQRKYYIALRHGKLSYWNKVEALSQGKDVLEIGCGTGGSVSRMASIARTLTGIDISDVAVERSESVAAEGGLSNSKFIVMNAENMDLEDSSVDVVYGSGILHHLDLESTYKELDRVMRDDGCAVFIEPLGHNVLINLYRRLTPAARSRDEHPLRKADLKAAKRHFREVTFEGFGLLTLATVPFRNQASFSKMLDNTIRLDHRLFGLPFFAWNAWFGLFVFQK